MRCLKESHLVKCLGQKRDIGSYNGLQTNTEVLIFKMKEAAQLLLEDCEQKAA